MLQLFFKIWKYERPKELRDCVVLELGDEGGEMHDAINSGRCIGGFYETAAFCMAIENIKNKYNWK